MTREEALKWFEKTYAQYLCREHELHMRRLSPPSAPSAVSRWRRCGRVARGVMTEDVRHAGALDGSQKFVSNVKIKAITSH